MKTHAIFIVLMFALVGCQTVVTFQPGRITANASGVTALEEIKADGSIVRSIDTKQQTWWDTLKSQVSQILDALAKTNPAVTVN